MADALCKLYKDPEGRVGQHLLYGAPRAGCPGLLADALLDLAKGLGHAHSDIRQAAAVAVQSWLQPDFIDYKEHSCFACNKWVCLQAFEARGLSASTKFCLCLVSTKLSQI